MERIAIDDVKPRVFGDGNGSVNLATVLMGEQVPGESASTGTYRKKPPLSRLGGLSRLAALAVRASRGLSAVGHALAVRFPRVARSSAWVVRLRRDHRETCGLPSNRARSAR